MLTQQHDAVFNDRGDLAIVFHFDATSLSPEQWTAFVTRLVACWNACEGLPTAELVEVTTRFPNAITSQWGHLIDALRSRAAEFPSQDGTWTGQDSKAAIEQGWDLFNENGVYGIERHDDATQFRTDDEAVDFVERMAAEGCELATKALRLRDTRLVEPPASRQAAAGT